MGLFSDFLSFLWDEAKDKLDEVKETNLRYQEEASNESNERLLQFIEQKSNRQSQKLRYLAYYKEAKNRGLINSD